MALARRLLLALALATLGLPAQTADKLTVVLD